MPMTYLCKDCDIHWSPHQTNNGACPACGSGCSRHTMQKVSDEAYVFAELARVERDWREKLDAFDAYIAQREAG